MAEPASAGVPVVDLTALVGQLRHEAERCENQQDRLMEAVAFIHGGLSRQASLLRELADTLSGQT